MVSAQATVGDWQALYKVMVTLFLTHSEASIIIKLKDNLLSEDTRFVYTYGDISFGGYIGMTLSIRPSVSPYFA